MSTLEEHSGQKVGFQVLVTFVYEMDVLTER